MNCMVVHLLRHGQPRRPGLLLGHTDEPPADPSGGLGSSLPPWLAIRRIVSSDLQRARCGARTLALAHDLPLVEDARWRELDFGLWDGLAPTDVPADVLARFREDPEACKPPQGESYSELRQRVADALAAADDAALVVTHAGAMRAAISVVTGLDHRQAWAFSLPYGALLSLRIWPADGMWGEVIGLVEGWGGSRHKEGEA